MPHPTPADLEAFRRDGYLVVRGILSDDHVARLRVPAEALRDRVRREFPPGTRTWTGRADPASLTPEQRAASTWGVNEITRPEFLVPEMVDVLGDPAVLAVTEALLGAPPRAWGLKMLWTPTFTPYDLGWHRDQMGRDFYDRIHRKPARQDHLQYNLSLGEDPCFVVVPGSHRRPLTAEEWAAVEAKGPPRDLPGQVNPVLGPGDVLFMDAHALHRGRSPTDGTRLTLHYSVQADWVPLKPWGDGDTFAWHCSDAFLARLSPTTRPLYERLRTAEITDDSLSFVPR